jgi:hypothetical protein
VFLFRDEFDFALPFVVRGGIGGGGDADDVGDEDGDGDGLWKDALSIANATFSSRSGRAIIMAQIGQGALLYSIASWGPLYLERVADAGAPGAASLFATRPPPPSPPVAFSSAAAAASDAASSLVLPQVAQALVGVAIGLAADGLSSGIGKRATRRGLQLVSGIIPAALLWYLSLGVRGVGGGGGGGGGGDYHDDPLLSPAFLFGAAQTASALSLGAVSVSHLDVASPPSAGAVYALGNVAAAASGSVVVSLLGGLLEDGDDRGGGDEFALPFRVIAILSAVGSLFYGCTVETELEIGFNETAIR